MNIENKTVLITGANRGIGRALLEEALRRGAKRAYAATRQPFTHFDGRVIPLTLDVTNHAQIEQAVSEVGTLDLLIHNAASDSITGAHTGVPIATWCCSSRLRGAL
ncbi:MAG TPA: SDR family NAD(P)-dependent oxidoreductase [Candidatus Sulfotelmatobacter sp.]